MHFIVQTLPYEVYEEAEKINRLFAMGMELLHIRKPLFTKKEVNDLLKGIDEQYHNKIVLHHHFSLAKRYKLYGVHISSTQLKNPLFVLSAKWLKFQYKMSISTTVDSPIKQNKLIDYCFVGPLFKKYSEENIIAQKDFFQLQKELNESEVPSCALNCYTLKNISQMQKIGFEAVVLQSFIWKSDDIYNAFNALKLKTENEVSSTKMVG